MSDQPTPDIAAVAADISIPATVATVDDNHLSDMARELAFNVLDDVRPGGEDFSLEEVEEATRILLLAAADLAHSINIFGKAQPVSTMLLHAMRETLDAYVEPVMSERH